MRTLTVEYVESKIRSGLSSFLSTDESRKENLDTEIKFVALQIVGRSRYPTLSFPKRSLWAKYARWFALVRGWKCDCPLMAQVGSRAHGYILKGKPPEDEWIRCHKCRDYEESTEHHRLCVMMLAVFVAILGTCVAAIGIYVKR